MATNWLVTVLLDTLTYIIQKMDVRYHGLELITNVLVIKDSVLTNFKTKFSMFTVRVAVEEHGVDAVMSNAAWYSTTEL